MIPQLWTWFADNFKPWLGAQLRGMMDALARMVGPWLLASFKIFGVVWALLSGLRWAIVEVGDALGKLALSDIVAPNSALLRYGAFMDRFLPLTEAFAMVVVLAHLWVSVVVVRWVKSFIPTMSN